MDLEEDNNLDEAARFEFEEVKPDHKSLKSAQAWWRWSGSLKRRYNLRLNAERQVERHLIERLPNLPKVGWFLTIWIIFVCLLIIVLLFQIRALTPYYTELEVAAGGTYTEGIVGQVTNFNPIYTSTEVDRSVARLVFANLFDYDQKNRLQPVLARDLIVDEKAQQYTVTLKQGLKWHDGQNLDTDDVVFTIETIKDPDAQSPLRNNWEGVSVDKIDNLTVKFTLPASFSPFASNLVLPILPQHLLEQENTKQLRNVAFNSRPVGSGPFIFDRLIPLSGGGVDDKEFRIQLNSNPDWAAVSLHGTAPLLDSLHFWVVPNTQRLTELFNQGQISGAFNLDTEAITLSQTDYNFVNLNLMNVVYLFFKNSSPYLQDVQLRKALASSLDVASLISLLDQSHQRVFGPLLPEHDGYALEARPPQFNPHRARQLLLDAGWQEANGGWMKDDQQLSLTLTTQKNTPYEVLAEEIKRQLDDAGIVVELDLRSAESVPFEILQNHNYGDMLIYGLNLGGDADVYSFWHSSQIDSNSTLRLNLAEYQSAAVDEALEVARSRNDADLRNKRYADFQAVWMNDLPALALYRFHLTYYTLNNVQGPSEGSLLINNSDRFFNIESWAAVQNRRTIKSGQP